MILTELNHYHIKEEIYHTENSRLYLAAKDPDDDTKDIYYAIKEYRQDLPEEMLLHEEEIGKEIERCCPANITIPLLNVIEESGHKYAVMKYSHKGKFLSEVIKEAEENSKPGRIPFLTAIHLIDGILSSAAVLHHFQSRDGQEMGYLHLDLHPGNIFFENIDLSSGKYGHALFIDLANSVRIREPDAVWMRNWRSVTEGFSAPEIQEEIRGAVMESTDLYSIAQIFSRMVFGRCIQLPELKAGPETPCIPEQDIVTKFLMMQFLKNCLQENSLYRYTDQAMRDALSDLEESFLSYRGKKHFRYYQLAYRFGLAREMAEAVTLDFDQCSFDQAQKDLEESIRSDQRRYPEQDYYIFRCLYHQAERNVLSMQSKSMLAYSGSSLCNYTGRTQEAVELIRYALDHGERNTLDQSVAILNRLHVTYADTGEYEEALGITRKIVETIDQADQLNRQISPVIHHYSDRARAYSAMGTYRSMLMLPVDETLECFEYALSEFASYEPFNINMTRSKLMHFAIMQNDRELFQRNAVLYFKGFGKSPEAALAHLLSSSESGYNPYAMHLLLKGICTFYIKEVEETESLQQLLADASASPLILSDKNHTKILILKYLALIRYKANGEQADAEVKSLLNRSVNAIPKYRFKEGGPMNIFTAMSLQSLWIRNEICRRTQENSRLFDAVIKACQRSGWKSMCRQLNQEKTLRDIVRHEYC